jgi:uncharacterized membrane protein (DUF373 family)
MRYFHDVNSIIKKRLNALIWYTVFKNIDIWYPKTVFFNGRNDDNLVFCHWKILSCDDLGYQMSIFKKKLYIKLKPLISFLLWNLHHENISFRSKVIPINVLENTYVMRYFHDVNSIIKKRLNALIWYTVFKNIDIWYPKTVFFNGRNDDNL